MGTQALRKGRYSEIGQIYLITFCTHNRHKILTGSVAIALSRYISKVTVKKDHQFLCWVVMPDHVHLLVQLGAYESLSELMRRIKASSSIALKRMAGVTGKVWQSGYHDRTIRKEEDLKGVARYIVANPIRAGLVKSVRYYPYWNAIWV